VQHGQEQQEQGREHDTEDAIPRSCMYVCMYVCMEDSVGMCATMVR